MSAASELFEEHREIFERPEFRRTWPDARVRFDIADGEAWVVGADGERLVVRRSGPDDPEPHLVVGMGARDFGRLVTGETDLFVLLRSAHQPIRFAYATGVTGLEHSREDLLRLVKSVLSGLALSCQCRGRFRGTVLEQVYMSQRSLREDGEFEPMEDWSLPYYAGEILYRLVTSEKLERTLEVGMAHALSTLLIAQAHEDNGGGHHVAIDPWQDVGFRRCGVMNVRRAGLDGYVEVIEEPDYTALPRLLDAGGERFQLVFIDGLHIFDHVMLDFFYGDLLLEVGGYAVFDDSDMRPVRSALSYILENRYESYERVPALSTERIVTLRKIAADNRVEQHGVTFHRDFTSQGPPVVPMPPPAASRFVKHAFERTLALLLLVALSPLAVLAALGILANDLVAGERISTPFHRIPRISAGRRFDMIRFRTFKPSGGPGRPSRIGALLRRLHLDGLPLLWNVLSGTMSLVGPKPILPEDRGRRDLYRDCGMRAGLTTAHLSSNDEVSPQAGHGFEYYDDYTGRSQLSLLAFDVRVLARRLVGMARSTRAGR